MRLVQDPPPPLSVGKLLQLMLFIFLELPALQIDVRNGQKADDFSIRKAHTKLLKTNRSAFVSVSLRKQWRKSDINFWGHNYIFTSKVVLSTLNLKKQNDVSIISTSAFTAIINIEIT